MTWLLKLLVVGAIIYLLIAGFVFLAQTSLLFPTRMVGAAGPLPPGAASLELDLPSGERLHGIHVPPLAQPTASRSVVIGFAGNAWNAAQAAFFLSELLPDRDVVAFHYRGYAPSGGRPSADALLADAPLIHDFVARRFPGRPIVAVGLSIGSGVAARLAAARPIAGAVLVTPFDSLAAVAADHYRWLPVRLLFRHRMEPAQDLRGSNVRVAIIAADRDTLIPPPRTRALAATIPTVVFDRSIPGVGHNDIYQHPAFRSAIAEALEKIEH